MADDPKPEIESATMRYLGRRDYSSGELRDKLLRKDFERHDIDAVLDDFIERGWIDDRRFAEQQAGILHRKEWGPLQIVKKLTRHGVDWDMAREVADALGEEKGWVEPCRARLKSRYGDVSELDQDEMASAYRHLTYRGYPANLVRSLLFDGR